MPEHASDAGDWAPGMDPQRSRALGALGKRMSHAVQRGYGTRATRWPPPDFARPQISKDSANSLLSARNRRDLILGPAGVGDYYLLGLEGRFPFLTQGAPWSTDGSLEKTLNILKIHSLSYLLRNTLSDADTLDHKLRARQLEPLERLGIG
jgi:glycosyltransferase A (GT-A) superfamily protein (DUF2064 family)